MKNPLTVLTKDFIPQKIVFDSENFIIAVGLNKDKDIVLAMRWMGENEIDFGFPNSFGHPVWFLIHYDLMEIILAGLVSSSLTGVDKMNVVESFKSIYLG